MALAMLQLSPVPPFDPVQTLPEGDWLTTVVFFVSMALWLAFVGWLVRVFLKAKHKRDERRRHP